MESCTYYQLRTRVCTGDPIGVKGKGVFGRIIRFVTNEDYSHVAIFVWHGEGLWVYEFVGGRGYQCMPASQWFELRSGQTIFVGEAPLDVRLHPQAILTAVSSFRAGRFKQHYGNLSLLVVAAAQWLKFDYDPVFKVCSTFVQYCWGRASFPMKKTADPGDIMKVASNLVRVKT